MALNVGTPYFSEKAETKKNIWTLVELLVDIKEIIKANLMYDRKNPTIILCDEKMEKVFKMKAIHICQIRSLVLQHLELVEVKRTRPINVPPTNWHRLKYQSIDMISAPLRRNPFRSARHNF